MPSGVGPGQRAPPTAPYAVYGYFLSVVPKGWPSASRPRGGQQALSLAPPPSSALVTSPSDRAAPSQCSADPVRPVVQTSLCAPFRGWSASAVSSSVPPRRRCPPCPAEQTDRQHRPRQLCHTEQPQSLSSTLFCCQGLTEQILLQHNMQPPLALPFRCTGPRSPSTPSYPPGRRSVGTPWRTPPGFLRGIRALSPSTAALLSLAADGSELLLLAG